jgi:hypothetical protein
MILAFPKAPEPIPVPVADERPVGWTSSETIEGWMRRSRELRADLVAAYGGVDADVQSADLRAAERQIDMLSVLGRWAA